MEAMTDNTLSRASARERVETHRSLRVIFVDDEKPLQELMRSELPRLGHEVTICPDGKTALKTLEKSTFDAAILDLRMPGMTGIEVLEHLKKVSPDTEAIVMTGHAFPAIVDDSDLSTRFRQQICRCEPRDPSANDAYVGRNVAFE